MGSDSRYNRTARDLNSSGYFFGGATDDSLQALSDHAWKAIELPGEPHNHTWASTLWIITRGISEELEAWMHADVVLVDRAVPDALGYYRAALAYRGEQPDPRVQARLEALVRDHSTSYDLLYRTTLDPGIPLGDNKRRDPDQTFRQLADHHVAAVLHDLGLPHRLLPSDGHDQALDDTLDFIMSRLSGVEGNTS